MSRTDSRWRPLVVALLLGLAAFSAGNKIRLTRGLEYFDPRRGDCLFWTEGAVQFRYARMAASAEPIPRADRMIQSPEGIDPARHLCLLMERTIGGAYRVLGPLFGRPPFHVWAAFAPHVVGSIGVLAAFLAACAVWGSSATAAGGAAGLTAAALYAFSLATVGRSIGSFGHEDFALPLLFLGVAFLLRLARVTAPIPGEHGRHDEKSERATTATGARYDGPLAALFLAAGLGAWHFSRFVHLLLVAALGLRLLAADGPTRSAAARALAWATAGAFAAGAVFSVLRGSRFLLSPQLLLSVALLASWALEARGPRLFRPAKGSGPLGRFLRRAGVVIALFVPLVLAASQFWSESEGFAHVYALFEDKVRFLGRKPADPSLLSPEGRSLWIEDFASPSLYLVVVTFGAPLLLALAAIASARPAKTARGRRAPEAALRATLPDAGSWPMLLVLALLSGLSFLLVKRLFVIFVFFLAVVAGGAAAQALPAPGARRPRLVPLFVLLALLGFEAHKVVNHGRETPETTLLARWLKKPKPLSIPNWHANDLATVEWIRRRTAPDDAFVARVGSSPMVLAYADRPVVLHSKYEVPGIRERARALDDALYGSETDLYRFCREHGARYYLHEMRTVLESGPDSERYVGCALRLRTASAAYRLQFAGEHSRYFRLLYRNVSYCIYQVASPQDTSTAVAAAEPLPPQPVYDIAAYGQSLEAEYFDDSATDRVVAQTDGAIQLLVRGQALMQSGQLEGAIRDLERAHRINPSLIGLNATLGLTIAMAGDFERALPYCRAELPISPDLSLTYANLGFVEGNLGLYADAKKHLGQAVALDPENPGLRRMLADVENAERFVAAKSAAGDSARVR